ncbi:serine/threonine-protein kinase, putative [Pediculus humanus corporis]|uniref:Serine/threonine-protein kinase, putative n=1 Tax=Pediculus humanus subsp. corporis TaxID=121224 RepID=E0VKX8_PEDHC|nr:serine/threonine-protein kinase, putative [Pediculus humanus corporis]EEB14034.1 serine/threonine-protein kinase, putative [Pediculus humanus corporis]
MGNLFRKSNSCQNSVNLNNGLDDNTLVKYLNVNRPNFYEANFLTVYQAKTRVPHSPVSHGLGVDFPKENKTLSPLSLSKTNWPVPFFESLFLPEFKIREDVTEDSFSIIGTISSGAFSNVYQVKKNDDNKIYAMKVLSKAQLVANNLIDQVKEEVKIQKVIGHNPFIVHCPYHWQSRKQLYIVSEFISGGELFKLLQEKNFLPLDIVKLYVAELAMALDFLHNAGIIYRDLKLENILLNSDGHIQLIDFGLSKWLKYGMRTNTICGTLQYIAPEVLQQKSYSHAVDWWSLGIVLVYMISGQVRTLINIFYCISI